MQKTIKKSALRCAFSSFALIALSGAFGQLAWSSETLAYCQDGIQEGDCIIRQFKDTEEAKLIRGKAVFGTYCVLCHGVGGAGDGRAAKIHDPKPTDFTQAVNPLAYFELIVRQGGEALGRSKGMPPWGDQLTDEQIKDVTFYAHSLRQSSP